MLALSWGFFLPAMLLLGSIDYSTWTIGHPHVYVGPNSYANAYHAFMYFAPGFLPAFYVLFLTKNARASQRRFNDLYMKQIGERLETAKWVCFLCAMLIIGGSCLLTRLHPVESVVASLAGLLAASLATKRWVTSMAVPKPGTG
jgi:hypothetical protein